jgi:hypothetical protein
MMHAYDQCYLAKARMSGMEMVYWVILTKRKPEIIIMTSN